MIPMIPPELQFKWVNKAKQNKQGNMEQETLCEESTDITGKQNREEDEETLGCNRIFLNFTRECRHPAKDKFNIAKAKDLFKYLSERQDLQEMKVSGWLGNRARNFNTKRVFGFDFGVVSEEGETKGDEEDEEEEEEEKDAMGSCFGDRSTPRGGGQRFAMSRDFWYRKLNTLKAQKLDEVALEAKDLPPDDHQKEPRGGGWVKDKKTFASETPETRKSVFDEIECFERRVAKPVEKKLEKQFVNVYDNRRSFTGGCK